LFVTAKNTRKICKSSSQVTHGNGIFFILRSDGSNSEFCVLGRKDLALFFTEKGCTISDLEFRFEAINKLILAPLLMLNLGGHHCNTVHGWQQAQALGMKLTTVQVMILQQIDLQEEALSE